MEILIGSAIKVRQGYFDELDHIFFIGRSGAGKTLLGNLLFSEDNSHRVPTDSVGVGRYNCTGVKRVVKVDDATPEFLASGENISTFLKMHRANWAAKKHGGTETFKSAIAYITSNVTNLQHHIENSGCSYEAVKRKSLILTTNTQLDYGEGKNYSLTDLGTEKLLLYFLLHNRFGFLTHHRDTIRTMQTYLMDDIANDDVYLPGEDEDPDLSAEEDRFALELPHSQLQESYGKKHQTRRALTQDQAIGSEPTHSTPIDSRTNKVKRDAYNSIKNFKPPTSPIRYPFIAKRSSDWDAMLASTPKKNSTIHAITAYEATPKRHEVLSKSVDSKNDTQLKKAKSKDANCVKDDVFEVKKNKSVSKKTDLVDYGPSTSGVVKHKLKRSTPLIFSDDSSDDFVKKTTAVAPKKGKTIEKKPVKKPMRRRPRPAPAATVFPEELLIDSLDERVQRKRNPSAIFPSSAHNNQKALEQSTKIYIISSNTSSEDDAKQENANRKKENDSKKENAGRRKFKNILGKRTKNKRNKRKDDDVYTASNPMVRPNQRQLRVEDFINSGKHVDPHSAEETD